nr:MAG TPA: hypothetical protein [Caudoviricetes sp.]
MDTEKEDSLSAEAAEDEVLDKKGASPDDLIAQAEQQLQEVDAASKAEEKDPKPADVKDLTPQQKEQQEKLEKMIASWPEEDKKLFASAPENLRALLGKYYHNFQADHTKKTQQAAALRAELEAKLATLAPVVTGKFKDMKQFASYVADAQRFEEELKRDPLRTLSILAQQAGVDLAQLQGYKPDPTAEALRPMQAQLAQMQQMLSQKTQPMPAQPKADPWQKTLNDFAQAVDEKGQKTHPYFEQVAPIMGLIMQRDGHEDLDKAYKEALFSLPAAREELLEKERQQAAQKQADLDKAKRAALLQKRTQSLPHVGVSGRKKTIDDIIAQAQQELDGQ